MDCANDNLISKNWVDLYVLLAIHPFCKVVPEEF